MKIYLDCAPLALGEMLPTAGTKRADPQGQKQTLHCSSGSSSINAAVSLTIQNPFLAPHDC